MASGEEQREDLEHNESAVLGEENEEGECEKSQRCVVYVYVKIQRSFQITVVFVHVKLLCHGKILFNNLMVFRQRERERKRERERDTHTHTHKNPFLIK